MKRASKFVVSPGWKILLADLQMDAAAILAAGGLPADLLNSTEAKVTPAEYYRLWEGLQAVVGDLDFPLLMADALSAEVFDPPIFASMCSANFNEALLRMQKYKPLIAPLVLHLEQSSRQTRVKIECYGNERPLPPILGLSEAAFFTQLVRIGTRHKVQPLEVKVPNLPEQLQAYQKYFGVRLKRGRNVTLTFDAADANRPFLTSNAGMWEFFSKELNRRLKDLDSSASTVDRVTAVLHESLPCGDSAIEVVAAKLGMSKRSLQRKLGEESVSYQAVLKSVREKLAAHYLTQSDLPQNEIAFLLGFSEPNSFARAFSQWTGKSPGQFRQRRRA